MNQQYKYLKWTTCPNCQKSITVQTISKHTRKCTGQNLTKHCKQCNVLIPNYKKFCCRHCSAVYNNKHRGPFETHFSDESIQRIKDSNNHYKSIRIEKYMENPNRCNTCGIILPYELRTRVNCSRACYKQQSRNRALSNKLGGPIVQRREVTLLNGDRLVVDSSWEEKLANNLILENVKFVRCDKFLLSTGETYTPDFYLPEYNCYVDPKAITSYFQKQQSQLIKIELFEKEYKTKVVLIHNVKDLTFSFIKNHIL